MRICILDDEYDCPAWEAAPDDWRVDPTPFLKSHDFTVEGLTKETAVPKLTRLSREGYDVFFNLLAGAWDEESPGIEVVQALERLNVPFTGATSVRGRRARAARTAKRPGSGRIAAGCRRAVLPARCARQASPNGGRRGRS